MAKNPLQSGRILLSGEPNGGIYMTIDGVETTIVAEDGTVTGGGFINPMPNGTFLQTIDKNDNTINVAGYLGELLFIGDLGGSGNPVAVFCGEVDGTTSETGTIVLGKDAWSTTIRKEDVTDPDNPVLIESYEEQASYTGFESRYENGGESFFGFEYLYGNYSLVVSNNQTIQDFVFEGNNDGLSRVEFAGRKIEATLRDLGNERGTIIDRVTINGTPTDAIRIGDGGLITFKLLSRFDFDGVGYAQFETGNNTGTYAYQFGAGTTVPTDATAGWSGGAIFGDSDATAGSVDRYWLNTGTSSSALFRRLAFWDNAAAYTVTNDVTTRTFDANTVTLAELADVVGTLLRDLNIT
jgi:hypothetical protein